MGKDTIETTKGLCVVALTRFLMQRLNTSQVKAYAKLLDMEIYKLLMDTDTRLYLETNEYLCQCCKEELDYGEDALYDMINSEEALQ